MLKVELVVEEGAEVWVVDQAMAYFGQMVAAIHAGESEWSASFVVYGPENMDVSENGHPIHAVLREEDTSMGYTEEFCFSPDGGVLSSEADDDF